MACTSALWGGGGWGVGGGVKISEKSLPGGVRNFYFGGEGRLIKTA